MGVYVKGMEMPTEDEDIIVRISSDGTVMTEYANPIPWAKAVSVPPHGRLIDADALIDDLKRQCKEVFRIDAVSPEDFWINRYEAYRERLYESWCEGFYEYVGSRPTIIPAEEGE